MKAKKVLMYAAGAFVLYKLVTWAAYGVQQADRGFIPTVDPMNPYVVR